MNAYQYTQTELSRDYLNIVREISSFDVRVIACGATRYRLFYFKDNRRFLEQSGEVFGTTNLQSIAMVQVVESIVTQPVL